MDRRGFLKQVVATAAVGAVAPQVLAEPVTSFTTPWMAGPAGASRIVLGGVQHEVVLDTGNWAWKLVPVVLKARQVGITTWQGTQFIAAKGGAYFYGDFTVDSEVVSEA